MDKVLKGLKRVVRVKMARESIFTSEPEVKYFIIPDYQFNPTTLVLLFWNGHIAMDCETNIRVKTHNKLEFIRSLNIYTAEIV